MPRNKNLDEYEKLRREVQRILDKVDITDQPEGYELGQDYGSGEQTFVRFDTAPNVRDAARSRTVLYRVQQLLDDDGHFGHLLHFFKVQNDYILIVQFGDTPIVL